MSCFGEFMCKLGTKTGICQGVKEAKLSTKVHRNIVSFWKFHRIIYQI